MILNKLKAVLILGYRKVGRNKLFNILTLIILIIGGYYVFRHKEDFNVFSKLSILQVATLVTLNILLLIVNAITYWYLYRKFKLTTTLVEAINLSIVTSFGNAFLPFRSGMGVQAIYLKKFHKLRYAHFISTVAGSLIISFFTIGVLGILSMIVIYVTRSLFSIPVFLAFIGLPVGMIFVTKTPDLFLRLIPFKGLKEKAKTVLEGWKILSKSPKQILILGLLTVLSSIIISLIVLLQFKFLGISKVTGDTISFFDSIFLSSFLVLSIFINITPSALGTKEVLLAYASTVVAISPQSAVVASVLDRVVGALVLLVLGPIAMYFLKKRINKESSV